jgi:hypothetical protein
VVGLRKRLQGRPRRLQPGLGRGLGGAGEGWGHLWCSRLLWLPLTELQRRKRELLLLLLAAWLWWGSRHQPGMVRLLECLWRISRGRLLAWLLLRRRRLLRRCRRAWRQRGCRRLVERRPGSCGGRIKPGVQHHRRRLVQGRRQLPGGGGGLAGRRLGQQGPGGAGARPQRRRVVQRRPQRWLLWAGGGQHRGGGWWRSWRVSCWWRGAWGLLLGGVLGGCWWGRRGGGRWCLGRWGPGGGQPGWWVVGWGWGRWHGRGGAWRWRQGGGLPFLLLLLGQRRC